VVTDGPYPETQEVLAGYTVVECASLVFVRAHHHEETSGTRPPGPDARCSPVPAARGLPALQRMAGNAAVTRWVRERRATPAPPTAAVQRAPQDWKNTATKKALANEKALAPNDPFVHTLHHIVPKSMLAALAGHLTPAQRTLVVQLVGPHAKKAFTRPTTASLPSPRPCRTSRPTSSSVPTRPTERTTPVHCRTTTMRTTGPSRPARSIWRRPTSS